MKKERFDKLVTLIAANPLLYSTHKVTIKDGLEIHTFGDPSSKGLDEAKALFKEKGYHGPEVYVEANKLNNQGKLISDYYTFLYNTEKDKISISYFRVGYSYADRKERFYPIKKSIPILAWTKHMYSFRRDLIRRDLKNKLSPRIQLGEMKGLMINEMSRLVTNTLYNIDYTPTAWISYRYFMNTANEYEAIERYTGSKLPEALKHYSGAILLALYKSLKDFTKLEPLLSHIYNTHPKYQSNVIPWDADEYQGLSNRLTCMHYDMFVLLICNKITDEEYKSILIMSNSADIDDITVAQEIIKFKLEDGSN